ncbi:glucose-1-phosphate adenylyltransferase [bacterium DOLZORAL124_64_63]|nr:MAG: glucose-1-phosphate adenylyltransferase [bacterium DOLZORAL124_64_63]
MKNVTAIILGGGRGTRLFPLTLERSKPAVAFAGKYRLIDIPISNCINSGLKKVFVLTQFLSASMHRHIMQTYTFDNFTDGFVDILAAEQTNERTDWFQGTSDAVRATLNHTMYFDSTDIVILGGDHLYRMDYSRLVKHHRQTDADITLAVYPVVRDEASRMGLMKVDDTGRITEFTEKPKDPAVIEQFRAHEALFRQHGLEVEEDKYLASMGIYVFKPQVLKDLLQDPAMTDFGKEVIPGAIGDHKVMAYPFDDYWRDIGTISAFFDANLELVDSDAEFNLYKGGWPFYTRTRNLPPSSIIEADLTDTIVAEGSKIVGATISHSVLGIRSRVRRGSVLKHVVMQGNDSYEGERQLTDTKQMEGPGMGVGRNCRIERCIIDKNARIGDNVIIRPKPDVSEYEDDLIWIRDGITVVPKGKVIPPGTVL